MPFTGLTVGRTAVTIRVRPVTDIWYGTYIGAMVWGNGQLSYLILKLPIFQREMTNFRPIFCPTWFKWSVE